MREHFVPEVVHFIVKRDNERMKNTRMEAATTSTMKQKVKRWEVMRYIDSYVQYGEEHRAISEMRIRVNLPTVLSARRKVGGQFQNVCPCQPQRTWINAAIVAHLEGVLLKSEALPNARCFEWVCCVFAAGPRPCSRRGVKAGIRNHYNELPCKQCDVA
jgi:protoporphyrinogen oxidase